MLVAVKEIDAAIVIMEHVSRSCEKLRSCR